MTANKRNPSKKEKSFEESLEEVEQIVARLEGGDIPLAESLELYERGISALRRCHELLDRVEQRIQTLSRDKDNLFRTSDFRSDEEASDKQPERDGE